MTGFQLVLGMLFCGDLNAVAIEIRIDIGFVLEKLLDDICGCHGWVCLESLQNAEVVVLEFNFLDSLRYLGYSVTISCYCYLSMNQLTLPFRWSIIKSHGFHD